MTMISTLAADWHFLVSPWKPLIPFAILLAWGWVISSKLDKDAQYWHFARREWNLAHLLTGIAGLAIMLAPVDEPWWFYVGVPLGVLVMASSPLVYVIHHNRNVPEDKKFTFSMASLQAGMQQRRAARAAKSASLTIIDSNGVSRIPPDKESPLFPVHMAMEEILVPAVAARATTIDVTPAAGGPYQVGQVIDGVRYRREPIAAPTANAIIDYLKDAAGLDVSDKRRKQTGDFQIKVGAEFHDVRLRTAGSSAGQQAVVEIDIKKRVVKKPEELGLYPKQMEALAEATRDQHGVVLVSAPAGGGRTTTQYALLRRHDSFTSNIRTLEIEQLAQLDGVGHAQFNPQGEEKEFAIQLRSILRRDPNIVMVADVPDAKTLQEAAAPGPSGPLIYVGVRADSGMEALAIWIKGVGDRERAAAPLRAVVAERLVRRLCETCRVPYQPAPDQLRKLGLPPDQVKQLFKPSGKIMDRNREETCPMCGGTGYVGQVGVFEVMRFDDEARALTARGDLNGLRDHLRRQRMMTLQEAALRKALEGVTSIEEVIRVTRPAKAPAKNASEPTATASA